LKKDIGGLNMSNVFEKLQQARVQLQNEKLKKSGKNAYAGFSYFE
jgi:predicted aldo/keto reductase-like oxidoreductase